jgi:5-methyltetrahydrofolate--homocysteine methyltransferase
MSRDIQVEFHEEDWARIERDWTAWWEGELDRPLVMIHGYQPRAGEDPRDASLGEYVTGEVRFTSEFPSETPIDDVLDFYEVHLERKRYYGDAWPRWWPNFGPGIVAGFLGSRVTPVPGTVWFEPSEETALEDLHPSYDPENVWWQRIRSLTRSAVERWGSRVSIAHTDLGGNLDILASLRTTEQLLFDVSDAPDEVERIVRGITRLWLRYYDELDALIQEVGRGTTPWAPVWSPGRCYMLQSDFSYMISPQMFERFVLPDIASCCDALDHGFYHLDGKGQIRHLDMLLSLPRLRGIQWIPGDGQPPPEEWLPLLERIRDGGKLCQLYVTARGARKIVDALGGRGFALFVINPMRDDEAREFLNSVGAGPENS